MSAEPTPQHDSLREYKMTDEEIKELSEKIQYGLRIAERRMLEEKALHGQDIVVCDENNNIKRIPAKEALDKLNKLFPF